MAVRIHKSDGSIESLDEFLDERRTKVDHQAADKVLSDGGALARRLKEALDRSEAEFKTLRPRKRIS